MWTILLLSAAASSSFSAAAATVVFTDRGPAFSAAGGPTGIPYVNCPYRPRSLPATLPSPLPDDLTDAFAFIGKGLDALVDGKNDKVSGVVSVAYRGKTIYTHGAGETKRGNGVKPTENTLYRVGSVSKIFPSLQLYMLAANPGSGVHLDDTLEQHGNRIKFINPFGQDQPTLRELASQRSGLPRMAPCPTNPYLGGNEILCGRNTPEDMAQWAEQTVLIHAPGTENGAALPSYSNMAYSVLGREITPPENAQSDSATGSWEDWVQKNILDAANLTRTGFELAVDGSLEDVAMGYVGDQAVGTYFTGYSVPAGGMHSTTKDLNKLADAIMSGALIPDSDLREDFLGPQYMNTGGGATTAIGAPWEFQLHNNTGFFIRRKGGNVPGYAAIVGFVPSLRLSVAITVSWIGFDEFTSSWFGFEAILGPFSNMLMAQEIDAGLPQPKDQSAFLGNYSTPVVGGSLVARISTWTPPGANKNPILLVDFPGLGQLTLSEPAWASTSSGKLRYLQADLRYDMFQGPCLNSELGASNLQYLIFSADLSSWTMPGMLGTNVTMTRIGGN